jgi:hypothetical protein
MSRVPDKDVNDTDQPATKEPVGKVEFDSRGNSVWRWARDVIESTSVLLKRLENKDLALEPTQKVPVVRGADATQKASNKKGAGASSTDAKAKATTAARHPAARPAERKDTGGGFDPYNSR